MSENAIQAVVVGAGTMGTTLAKLMAVQGVKVIMVDTNMVDTNSDVLETSRLSIGENAAGVCFTTKLQAMQSPDFVIECVTENTAVKQKVVAQIESSVPDTTIIMTNFGRGDSMPLAEAIGKAPGGNKDRRTRLRRQPHPARDDA